MKQYVSFISKEFMHILRDRRSMLILLAVPVVLLLLFGYAVSTEVKNVRVAVLDMSHDGLTRKACDRLAANPYMSLDYCVTCIGDVYSLFRQGKADVAVVFGHGFADDLVHKGTAKVIRLQYVMQVLASMQQEHSAVNPSDAKMNIVPITRMLYNPQQKSEYNFVPGVMGLLLMLVCVMMGSVAIVREKETGTMEVLLASPLSPACIILSKLVPYFVISSFNVATVLVLSRFVLGVPMSGSLWALLGATLLYILVCLTLGLFVSTLVRTQVAAMVVSMLFIIPTVYLSGLAFPIESMPNVLQYISTIVPARWYIDAARRLMIQGMDAQYILTDVWVMLAMEAVLLVVALKKFKIRI